MSFCTSISLTDQHAVTQWRALSSAVDVERAQAVAVSHVAVDDVGAGAGDRGDAVIQPGR